MAGSLIYNSVSTEIREGISLIEASAGTGKTFAISMLVLRAVAEKEISIDQILVVTFTIAATEELRGRIRSRLSQGRDALNGIDHSDDPVLAEWVAGVKNKERTDHLLKVALLDIDRAGIYTIHGFCQRMLTEQALESGQLFDTELTGDAALVKSELIRDFWRARLYGLDRRYCSIITSIYGDPDKLYQSIRGSDDLLADLIPTGNGVECACTALEYSAGKLKNWWDRHGGSMRQHLKKAENDDFLNKKFKENYQIYCENLDGCAAGDAFPSSETVSWLTTEKLLAGLNGRRLRGEKKVAYLESWSLPGEIIDQYLNSIETLILEIRLELASEIRIGLSKRLKARGLMSFDDLILQLSEAVSSVNGAELRRLIGQRYRIALIDEFQDTDSAQWSIFYRLFGSGKHSLYLIGDPKQAIYRFRGADIFSYFDAREKAARRLTLNKNFRSHPDLMDGVNDLFADCEIAGQQYTRVEPAKSGDDGQLKAFGQSLSSMVYCQLDIFSEEQPQWHTTKANDRTRQWVVNETLGLLDCSNNITIEIKHSDGTHGCEQIKPADIAILVRANKQAEQYQNELGKAGIPSVISSRTNVFSTHECAHLLMVLQGVTSPGDIRKLKAAMSCDWFGLSGKEFLRITQDDAELNSWMDRFQGYNDTWMAEGFLAMISRLLTVEKIYINLCSIGRAERRIANIQHLTELVQEAEQDNCFSLVQTMMWLHQMNSGTCDMEETELRLESDAEAVKIVTMHSAKGLEFPVVFCPFLMKGPGAPRKGISVTRCHNQQRKLIVDIGSEDFKENCEQAVREEWQEDMRLAYVAITRARLRCYLFWGDISRVGQAPASFESPMAKILFPDGASDFRDQQKILQNIGACKGREYRLIDTEPEEVGKYERKGDDNDILQARSKGTRLLRTNRLLTSFSGLASTSFHPEEALPGAFDETAIDRGFVEISKLPGGVRFGNIVHDALEHLAFSDLASSHYDKDFIAGLCRRYSLDVDQEILGKLIRNSVVTGLFANEEPSQFTLADIDPVYLVKEMGFTLHMESTDTKRINEILSSESTCVPVMNKQIEGYLTGFVDLICQYKGKYYVIDYKTNNLGDGPAYYGYESMQAAMRIHNYGLQYWLYTLVVHRYLSRWLPEYSYENNFGGVMYLFVRGMTPAKPGSGVCFAMPDKKLLDQLDHCFGGCLS